MKKLPLQTSIKINIPLQILVVEKSLTGMDIKKGSHIYCGSCGHTIGRATKDMELPLPHETFLKNLTGVKVQLVNSTYPCLYHTCGKFLFSDKASWVFIGYDEWKRQTDEMMVETVKNTIKNSKHETVVKSNFIDIENSIRIIKHCRESRKSIFPNPINYEKVFELDRIESDNYKEILKSLQQNSKSFKYLDDTKKEYIATGDYYTWWSLNLEESAILKGLIDLERDLPAIKLAYKSLKNIGHYIPDNVIREWVNLMNGEELTVIKS